MTNPDFAEFVHWTQHEAAIEARKVSLQEVGSDLDQHQRGLFATQTIFPGERVLFLPETSLIGSEMLQKAGQQVIASLLESSTLNPETLTKNDMKESSSARSAKDLERMVMGAIEELRQLLAGDDDDNSAVKQEAVGRGYIFRGDDAVALYLIACRYILQHFNDKQEPYEAPFGPPESTTSSSPPTPDHPIIESDGAPRLPPLVEAVPVTQGDGDDAPEQSIDEHVLEPVTLPPPSVDIPENEIETPSLPQQQRFPSFLPQVAVLPASFSTSPLSYSETELASIEGTNCHGYTTRMLQQIQSDWQQLHAVLQAFAKSDSCRRVGRTLPGEMLLADIVTLESYQWALQNIYSRSTDFEMTVAADSAPDATRGTASERRRRRVIAPLFDMMNHDFASEIFHAMDTDGNISVFNGSSRAIEAGEEICLCYGNFPNEKFMYIYGFAIMDNPFDAVSIYAPIPPSDPLHQVKARILETKCGIVDTNEPHALLASRRNQGQPIIPSSLLSVLRVVGIQSAEDVLALAAQETTDDMCVGFFSMENEMGALSALQQALYSMARLLALNLISDETIERAASMEDEGNAGSRRPDLPTPKQARALVEAEHRLQDPNFRNAKIICQSEYLILQAALAELAERLAALDGTMAIQQ
jgi:hypothetical protein